MMPSNTIETCDVRDVLRQLSFDSTPAQTPLSDLCLVRRSLLRHGFDPSHDARQLEVSRILSEVVESEWRDLRAACGATGGSASERIRQDFGIGHRELEAWSAVYHLYLRTDLNLYLKDFEQILGDRHRRTIQRRLRRGVSLLTSQLRTMERKAMAKDRRERFTEALPNGLDRPLLGAAALIERVCDRLGESGLSAIALHGPGGIGKSAIARSAAWRQIDCAAVEEAVWVPAHRIARLAKPSEESVLKVLAEHHGHTSPRAMKRCLLHRRCLVVIDGIDCHEGARSCLEATAALPQNAAVLLTGRVRFSTFSCARVLEVSPLRPSAATELLIRESRSNGISESSLQSRSALVPLVSAASGHPGALHLAARQLVTLDVDRIADDLLLGRGWALDMYKDMWEPSLHGSGRTTHLVVRAVARLRRGGVDASHDSIEQLTGIGGDVLSRELCSATELGLLVPLGSVSRRHYDCAMFVDRLMRASLAPESCSPADRAAWRGLGAPQRPYLRAV